MTWRMLATFLAVCGSLSGCHSTPYDSTGLSAGKTLQAVRARGYVRCGASRDTIGFSAPDQKGQWRGLDVDTCRAVAAAALGDSEKVRFVPLTGQQRLTALQTGEIDLLPRTTTWTLQRDANGINFTVPNYYDYTAFMVRADKGAQTLPDLAGASICIQAGSLTEVIFADVDRRYRMQMKPVIFDNVQSARQAFLTHRCDALLTDASALATLRAMRRGTPIAFRMIRADNEISALTPAVRHGDDQWFDIAKFAFEAMIVAEQLGINRANVDTMLRSRDPIVSRFLGTEPGNGTVLGIRDDFAYRIVKQVGNYADVYDDNLGARSGLNIPRGLNRLQRDGGLMLPIGFQ